MGKALSIAGARFSRLVVMRSVGIDRHKKRLWDCLCDCGVSVTVVSGDLAAGKQQSCGCHRRDASSARRISELSGSVFGKLTALSRTRQDEHGNYFWLCSCSCGNETEVRSAKLVGGYVISCGCARTDSAIHSSAAVRRKSAAWNATRRARKRNSVGRFTSRQIEALYAAQDGMCAICSLALNGDFHRDHKIALSRGGSNDISNIQLTHARCNLKKYVGAAI